MKKEDIKLDDWERIIFGVAPYEFLIEVFIRTIFTYIILLLVLKLLGKRMSGKMTYMEMAVMLMFGAIVASGIQIPDKGVIESAFVLFAVLAFQKLFTLWTVRSRKMDRLTLGTMQLMVKDGVMQVDNLNKELISHNQLFRKLRTQQITQLGEVKRLYIETSGNFTMYKEDNPKPGLSIFPKEDDQLRETLTVVDGMKVCYDCGTVHEPDQLLGTTHCKNCNSEHFENAVIHKTTK